MRHNSFNYLVFFCALALISSAVMAKNAEFPGRDTYPNIDFIELSDFHNKFRSNDTVVVDVRSSYEFQTLRINGAINVPLASKTFVSKMRELRQQNPGKTIVVYCNGKTCMKSYKAARKCKVNNIEKVVAYDAGIMDFARTHPKDAMLLGKPLNDPKKLISKDDFKKRLITPDQFGVRIAETQDIVLDVRDRFQREGLSIFVGREFRVGLDNTKRLDRYIGKAKKEQKALLIYDAAGKQVRWLQYYLEEQGMKNYFFMKGGIRSYYDQMEKEQLQSGG